METWQINISLIPSIAVVLSSSNRMALGLTEEINQWFKPGDHRNEQIIKSKIKQLKRLSLAIFLMYLSLSILIFNALIGGLNIFPWNFDKIGIFISIIIFLIAIYFKVRFSFKAYFIRQKQFDSSLKTKQMAN